MRGLLDNDFIYKIARFDLLGHMEALLASRSFAIPLSCLSTAFYVLKVSAASPSDKWPDPRQQQRLRAFLARCLDVPRASASTLGRLSVPGIDSGERLLFGCAIEDAEAVVFTGDKRALRTFTNESSLTADAATIAGRVVQLEKVVESLFTLVAPSKMRSAILANPVDSSLLAIFNRPNESECQSALADSIANLRSSTGNLLRLAL